MAGVAAAVAAARAGARTLLIDKAGFLGGLGVTGATGLHSFFNIFDAHSGAERVRVAAGLPQELVDRVGFAQPVLLQLREREARDIALVEQHDRVAARGTSPDRRAHAASSRAGRYSARSSR